MKKERGFLSFLAFNDNQKQSKFLLKNLLTKDQYTVLREIVLNNRAHNIENGTRTWKLKKELEEKQKKRLLKLEKGELKKTNLLKIYPILRILAGLALKHHELC